MARTAKYDRKLADVLAAAAAVFCEEGYDRASIRGVARRAGVSIAGLYYYVSSKEELLFLIQHRAFGELVEQLEAAMAEIDDPIDQLRHLIQGHLRRFLGNMAELVVCSREIDRLEGDFRRQVEARQRHYFRLARRIFADIAERHGGARVEPRTAALAMFGTINWIHTWYRPSGPSAARMADDFACLFLHGFLEPAAAGAEA